MITFFLALALSFTPPTDTQIKLDKEQEFIEICKTIAALEEFKDTNYLCNHSDAPHLFIKWHDDYQENNHIGKEIELNNFTLSLWFEEKLFFYNIPYWFEMKEIKTKKNGSINIEMVSYNYLGAEYKKPRLRCKFNLINGGDGYVVKKKSFKKI